MYKKGKRIGKNIWHGSRMSGRIATLKIPVKQACF